ncbi:MAG: SIR2 family protein [Planctomycetota bacterium]|nr:SIR2 family protein [Planctomycetota bacterium]
MDGSDLTQLPDPLPDDVSPGSVVLLLGAGFSAGAGLPTMSNFGNASRHELKALRELAESSMAPDPPVAYSGPMLVEAGRTFQRFQDYCCKASPVVALDTSNMEELFCIAESLRESHVPKGGPDDDSPVLHMDGDSYSIDYLMEQIQLWLWKIYQQLPPASPENPDAVSQAEPYLRLIKQLRADHVSNLTILTTNYDIVFEYFAHRGGMPCWYPIKLLEHLSVKDGRSSFLALGKPGPCICKLHGSINYFEGQCLHYREVCKDTIDDEWLGISAELTKLDDRIGGSRVSSANPAILAVGAIWALRAKYGPHITPAIIAPTYAKLRARLWLRETWAAAVGSIRNARLLLIIGYSMPPSDGFMRAMIQAAMIQRSPDNPLIVYVVDPANAVKDRYQELFKPLARNLIFVPHRFDEWIMSDDQIVSELLSRARCR